MEIALHLYVFLVGAVVGSFLNVVIARVPKGESIVHPRSRCPRCRSAIAWYDNVPILSWLVLRGKCRSCNLPISPRYPLVELLVGVLAVAVERSYGLSHVSLGYFVFAAALVSLAYIDLDTWLLPHQITWPLLALGLVSPLWNRSMGFVSSAGGAVVGFALFATIALLGEKVLKRETMGWGDVWLLSGIGAWLGWKALLPVVMLSSVQGAVVGIAMLASRRDGDEGKTASPASVGAGPPPAEPADAASLGLVPPASEAAPMGIHTAPAALTVEDDWVPPPHAVPFGPFLAVAALEFLLLGDWMIAWWDALLGRLSS
jgi:leader peptidase (prepilin peptidase)/N-methyltransferase